MSKGLQPEGSWDTGGEICCGELGEIWHGRDVWRVGLIQSGVPSTSRWKKNAWRDTWTHQRAHEPVVHWIRKRLCAPSAPCS